jgi:mycofactocin precursor
MEATPKEFSESNPVSEEREEDIYQMEEITIEEMAIDGICGVY